MKGVDRTLIAGAAVVVLLLAGWVLLELWSPIVVAIWTAALLDPLATRISKLARGKRAVGAAVAIVIVFALFVPVGMLAVSLVSSGLEFARAMLASPQARQALALVTSSETEGPVGLTKFVEVLQTHGATAWELGSQFAGAGAWALIVVTTFTVALFQFLVSGREIWAWLVEHAPLPKPAAERLGHTFIETGRGLFIGAGLTALAQAIVATGSFLVLGIPRAAILGALTFVGAFVPGIGTAMVWAPVALGLALNGQTGKAIVLTLIGLFGIGSIDNVLRPFLQRWGGHLDLSTWLLLVAAFGGLSAFGPAGLLLGPLVLRMAKEILIMAREQRVAQAADEPDPGPAQAAS